MYGKDGKNIKLIVDALTKQTSPSPKGSPAATTSPTKDEIKKFIFNFMYFADPLLQYTEGHVKDYSQDKNNPLPTEQSLQVRGIQNASDTLLKYLGKFSDDNKNQHKDAKKRIYIFDDLSTTLLKQLSASISALSPSNFHGFHNPLLLDALKAGMEKFTEQLGHAYVNVYSGKIPTEKWVKQESKQVDGKPQLVDVLSTEGRNCAKVCLTILEILNTNLRDLYNNCKGSGKWSKSCIRLYEGNKNKRSDNQLGHWFQRRGFRVSEYENTQNGELKRGMKGDEIRTLLVNGNGKYVFKNDNNKDDAGPLRTLFRYLLDYYKVTHRGHIASPKSPCNIYQMLQWLLGLYFNPMYQKLEAHIGELFTGLQKQYKLEHPRLEVTVPDDMKDKIKSPLNSEQLTKVLKQVCLYSADTLITFLGHGHSGGRYAVDFYTNTDNLFYPGSPASCFDMLADILNRVFYQVRFVYKQCNNRPESGGWKHCWYGRGVGGSSWTCNTMQCPNQTGDQTATQNSNQMHKQTCNQMCDQRAECGLKSPLQSFLEDGLPGFLPHSITSPGCKLTCSLPNHFGRPCLTPMGFSDISNVASRTQKGDYLQQVLELLYGPKSNFRQLCSVVNCLIRRPPQTLDDLLAFYYGYLANWSGGSKGRDNEARKHKHDAFVRAVRNANLGREYSDLIPTAVFGSSSHYDQKSTHTNGDVFSLVSCNPHNAPAHPCGRYLQPLHQDARSMFSSFFARFYLCWIVYTTENFYDLLKKLYDDCCAKCNKPGTKCHDNSCAERCAVKSAYEAEVSNPQQALSTQSANKAHDSKCHSIIECKYTHPTLYSYGFTFGSPHELSGVTEVKNRRTCIDLCNALKKVLSDKKSDNAPLAKLIYVTIPDFLWKIREPFSLTLLALWSLSLLYLLHITVVRLDVLRIRSHLRSPASHRIAAQSLLAAARVKALANVKYFSP
ncbi:hypothetical protein, conserved [Babesia ovata]|uniref:Uncharacterized protein n=1 Tax=Babesia ovata TaxID=189622 RepID=A0A2H6KKJ5_9APIC|nr:uncharacterized protein BOVATA_049950 [Babesia ovata]GBE63502.1 hypothetical protein, conserved [Babesia ovata]